MIWNAQHSAPPLKLGTLRWRNTSGYTENPRLVLCGWLLGLTFRHDLLAKVGSNLVRIPR